MTALGAYLKDRRARLDPASFGLPAHRRRTPGLRREEVAQRANVSATWYTWLEQGRGGAPSTDLLDRLSGALMLTDVEREHMYLLARGHAPGVQYHTTEGISPRLQRLLDSMEYIPAMVRTATWDVIAWNDAAAATLSDYSKMAPEQRNILRRMFLDPDVRAAQVDWETVARHVLGGFRADAVRAGASAAVQALVDELSQRSPDFARMWRDNDVRSQGGGAKPLRHPRLGLITLEFSSFDVEGRFDLSMIVYNPSTPADAAKVHKLIDAHRKKKR